MRIHGHRPIYLRFLLPPLAVAAAYYMTITFPDIAQRTPFALFFGAIALSAWYGGFLPAMFASSLSIFLTAHRIFPTYGNPSIRISDVFLLAMLFGIAVLISLLNKARVEASEKLTSERNWLQGILSSIGDGVIATDANGYVQFMNGVAEQLTGYTAAEAHGKKLTDIFQIHNPEGATILNPIEEVLRAQHPFELAAGTVLTRRDGVDIFIDDRATPIRDWFGNVIGAVLIFRDVTDAYEKDQALQKARQQNEAILDSIPDIVIRLKSDGTLLEVRAKNERDLYTSQNVIGKNINDIFPENFSTLCLNYIRKTLSTGSLQVFEYGLPVNGVSQDFEARLLAAGKDEVIAFIRNTTEQKYMEKTLHEQKDRMEVLNRTGLLLSEHLELNKLMQAVTDAGTELCGASFGAFFYNNVNEQGESYTLYTIAGAPRESFAQFPMPRNTLLFGPTFRGESIVRIDDIKQDPRHGKNAPFYGLPAGHLPVRSYLAVPVVSRTGGVIGGLFFGHPEPNMFGENEERIISGLASQAAIATDNARLFEETNRQREKAEESLKERELLLKEIHHRVKNNLQIISSLLNLQIVYAGEKSVDQILRESQSRIRSMALIHQKLYQSTDLARIDFEAYLRDLTNMLYQSYGVTRDDVDLRLEVDNVQLDIDTAIPCGLIVNELVSNCLKHAFPDGRKGNVTIRLCSARGKYSLEVSDNGIGMPEINGQQETLGLKLIGTLARQLDGTVNVIRQNGTSVRIEFEPSAI